MPLAFNVPFHSFSMGGGLATGASITGFSTYASLLTYCCNSNARLYRAKGYSPQQGVVAVFPQMPGYARVWLSVSFLPFLFQLFEVSLGITLAADTGPAIPSGQAQQALSHVLILPHTSQPNLSVAWFPATDYMITSGLLIQVA